MTREFWALLTQGLSRQRSALVWEAATGRATLHQLLESGLLSAIPARPGEAWPCGDNARPGCARRVVARGGELVAVCGEAPAMCAAEVLGAGAGLVTVERGVFLGRLAKALGIETRVEDRGGPRPVLLGERVLANERLRFLWVDRPRWSGLGDALFRMVSGEKLAALVLVVAHPSQVPAEVPREIGGMRVFWLALADAASWEDGRLSVDLADVILALELQMELGPALWPRYALVIDQRRDQIWYGGRLIRPTGMAAQLLAMLAERPGEIVTKREMILALWGDEIKKGKEPVLEKYDQRLRQIRSTLGQVFRNSKAPFSLPEDPVELVRGDDDLRAGYRLALGEGRMKLIQGRGSPLTVVTRTAIA